MESSTTPISESKLSTKSNILDTKLDTPSMSSENILSITQTSSENEQSIQRTIPEFEQYTTPTLTNNEILDSNNLITILDMMNDSGTTLSINDVIKTSFEQFNVTELLIQQIHPTESTVTILPNVSFEIEGNIIENSTNVYEMKHELTEQSIHINSNITSEESIDSNENDLLQITNLLNLTSPTNTDNNSDYLPNSSNYEQVNPKEEALLKDNIISNDYITNEAILDKNTSKINPDLLRKTRMIRQEELLNDFDVKVNNGHKLTNGEEISSFLYYSVAVIKELSNITSFDDLKGKKSCHGSVTSPSGK